MRFIVDDIQDVIQECLANGHFYEEQELKKLLSYSKPNWTIIDIGANVGNHSIYFEKYFHPKIIYSIEPLPQAYRLLLMNCALNYCHKINLDYIGLALGEKNGKCKIREIFSHNLGGTKLIPTNDDDVGDIVMVTGDSLFQNISVDLIKIDVEGMELDAIKGLQNTIRINKPLMYVEVDNSNISIFWSLMKIFKYKKIWEYRNYTNCINFLVGPSL